MNLALFDFDGTITTREMFPDFVHLAVEPRRIAFGKVVLAPLIVGYKLGLVPGTVVRAAIVKFGFSGVSLAALQTAASSLLSQRFPRSFDPKPLNVSIGTSRKVTL